MSVLVFVSSVSVAHEPSVSLIAVVVLSSVVVLIPSSHAVCPRHVLVALHQILGHASPSRTVFSNVLFLRQRDFPAFLFLRVVEVPNDIVGVTIKPYYNKGKVGLAERKPVEAFLDYFDVQDLAELVKTVLQVVFSRVYVYSSHIELSLSVLFLYSVASLFFG